MPPVTLAMLPPLALVEGFLHPALAAGAALASVPLIIHLLNRQRHRPMAWGAMRFVLAAHKRTRRRTQLESLLLLLLRMAGVALLAFALSRPFADRESPLAPLTETRRDVVLLIDGSASTGYRDGVDSSFERALDRARAVLGDLDGSRGDRVRLFLCGAWPRLLASRTPEQALSVLSTVSSPTDETLDLSRALSEVLRLAEDQEVAFASTPEVRLLTDMQRANFLPRAADLPRAVDIDETTAPSSPPPVDEEGVPSLDEALDRLHELGWTVLVEDVGPSAAVPANLGVAEVAPTESVLGPGVPVDVEVVVQNHGPRHAANVRVALSIDGERRPTRSVEVGAGRSERVIFPVVFRSAGHHALEAQLEGDALTFDDRRTRVVHVPPTADVLLVNGEPDAEDIARDEVGLIAAVLEPLGEDVVDAFRPFRPWVVFPGALGGADLELASYSVIVLANVANLSERAIERLEERVAAGAGLIVALGDNVVPETYDRRLVREDGTGLLPARLGREVRTANRREAYYRVGSFDAEHPALSFFADERWQPLLTEIPVYDFITAEPLEEARVLARFDDDARSPLLVERAYDRGRVLLWTTTLDTAWTRLPESPRTLVPLVHELVRYAGRPPLGRRNVDLGAPLAALVDVFPRGAELVRPDGTRGPIDTPPVAIGGGAWRLEATASAERRGTWRVELEGHPDLTFGVEADPGEGDLRRLASVELAALHPAWAPADDRERGADAGDTATVGGELWRWFAGLCFAVLLVESLFAAWLGHRRRVA